MGWGFLIVIDFEKTVVLCRQGDGKAQKVLYDNLAPQMLGIAFRYVGGYDLANEVLQLSFIKVFKNIDKVDPKKVSSWMRKITVNTALTVLKKERRSSQSECVDSVQKQTAGQEYSADIINLINTLPENKRVLFYLHAVEGYSFKEIGAMLNVSEGNARIRYHRIKKEVQTLLEKYFIES